MSLKGITGDDDESNIFQYVGGEYSILLTWKLGVQLVL